MQNFISSLHFKLLFLLVLSNFSRGANSTVIEDFSFTVQQMWAQSQRLSGQDNDFAQRALLFHKMYRDSGLSFSFALSVSHLTLAIERSTQNQKLRSQLQSVGLKSVARDLKKWSHGLAAMNRNMFTLTHFIFSVSRWAGSNSIRLHALKSIPQTQRLYSLITTLTPVFIAKKNGRVLSAAQQNQIFETFVQWEHRFLFQPKIQKMAKKFNFKTKYFLKNIPNKYVEAAVITPITGFRTTFSLKCFGDHKNFRTKNFLSASHRIQQARAFFKALKGIGFNPSLSCYNDEYYSSRFPQQFYSNPDRFLKKVEKYGYSPSPKNTPISIPRWSQLHLRTHSHMCSMPSSYFQDLARSLINVHSLKMQTSSPQSQEWEQAILRNLLINRAYIDLFLNYTHKQRLTQGTWMGSAAFGSATVGHKLRVGFPLSSESSPSHLNLTHYNSSPWQLPLRSQLAQQISQEKALKNRLAHSLAHNFLFIQLLAQSNLAVFEDIYWQFLADSLCGSRTVIRLLKNELMTSPSSKALKRSLKAWGQLSGNNTQHQLEGALNLLYVEQIFVLQPILYDPQIAGLISRWGVFNSEAQPGLSSPRRPLLGFSDYCRVYNLEANLTNPRSRYQWVSYLILEHHRIFQQTSRAQKIEALFQKELQKTNQILIDYQ